MEIDWGVPLEIICIATDRYDSNPKCDDRFRPNSVIGSNFEGFEDFLLLKQLIGKESEHGIVKINNQ